MTLPLTLMHFGTDSKLDFGHFGRALREALA